MHTAHSTAAAAAAAGGRFSWQAAVLHLTPSECVVETKKKKIERKKSE